MVAIAQGEGMGNTFYWKYNITLDPQNPLAPAHLRQWIYLTEGTHSLMRPVW